MSDDKTPAELMRATADHIEEAALACAEAAIRLRAQADSQDALAQSKRDWAAIYRRSADTLDGLEAQKATAIRAEQLVNP